MSAAMLDERTLIAQLLSEAIREATGQTGVWVRDVPYVDADAVLAELATLLSLSVPLRIAFLDAAAEAAAQRVGIPEDRFSTRVQAAETWRNTRALRGELIVVIARADAARLTSMEDFALISPAELRTFLVDRAAVLFSDLNEVLPRWWAIIGTDEQISFSDLVDYYLALAPLSGEALRDQSALQINRLGLLPDPAFFDRPAERELRKQLHDNRELALRLANFSEEDRQKVDDALRMEDDSKRKAELQRRLRDLQTYRRGGQLGLTAADARQLLKIRSAKRPLSPSPTPGGGSAAPPTPSPPPPRDLTGLAVEALLRQEGSADDASLAALDAAVSSLGDQIDQIDDSTVRPQSVGVTLPSGAKVDDVVATDVVNVVRRVIGEGRYGGLATVSGDDISSIMRNFQQSAKVVAYWDRDRIDEFLNVFAQGSAQFADIKSAFDRFDVARSALLPHLGELCVAPLLLATAPTTVSLIAPVISGYRELVAATANAYGALHEQYGDDARAFVERLMLIDTVFLNNGKALLAVLTPLHPLLLWHYFEYARVIQEQQQLLDVRDRELVRSEFESGGVPLFFASLGVPRRVTESGPPSLPFSGKFGGLPHFSERADARDPRDGLRPIRRLLDAFVALHPSAAEGLRLSLLDPPDAGAILSLCCDLADDRKIRGASVTVLRRGPGVGAELNLSSDEERRVQQRFGDHTDRRFTFQSRRAGSVSSAPPDDLESHLFVAFDQTERRATDTGAPPQKIQPLANRRRLVYRIETRSLDLEPALGGILADYSSLAQLAVGRRIDSYSTMHQTDALTKDLKLGAARVPWYVVADGHVDRDLDIGGLRVLTDREGTRDVVAFTSEPTAFRRSLRQVVQQFNTYVTDEKLDVLLRELSDLLDAGLLSLRPGRSGDIAHSHVRGILGLLVAVRSLRESTPAGHDRIIMSLDSEQARRWLHLGDDPHRADLLVIDGADGRFEITVVEVKTWQSNPEYEITGGRVSGPTVNQMLSTHRILRQVFDQNYPEALVTPSRREILREHLYRELSKASYPSDVKQRWARRSEQLFDGTPDIGIRCALVQVHLGKAMATLEPSRDVQALDGESLVPVAIRHLNEDGVPALLEALTPPEPPPDASSERPKPDIDPKGGGGPTAPDGGEPAPRDADDSGAPTTTDPGVEPEQGPKVLLGHSPAAYGHPREIWFDPESTSQRLSNPHISITGETGTGKTQAAKALLHDLLSQGVPALILDFKDDYSKPEYAEVEGFRVHDASFGSLPFNPMIPPVDPQSGRANPIAHVHELANMIQRIYKLGDQQAFQLREAMKETYEAAGVGFAPFVPKPGQEYLPFEAIRDVLVRAEATTLLGRLSPVFDLALFSRGESETDLDELLSTPTVIRLIQLPGDQVKNAVAEFFLMALYSFLIRRAHPHRLERILVLDEAWRLVNSPFLQPLMREGRAFGLGVIIATQFPKDLPEQVSGSTATRLFFGQAKAEQIREIQRTLVGKTSGTEANHLGDLVRGLPPLECILQNIQYRPWARLRTIPYYARVQAANTPE